MAGKDFGGLDFSEIFKDLNQLANQVAKSAENVEQAAEDAGKRVGESFSDGVERGLEDAASRIAASSLKINKAFKDLAKKITSQSISLGGISIDFSDIDVDSADFQKKISEVFEKFKIDNAIEFDSKASEKQFKNMLALHTKYAIKLSKLQEQRPKLTSQASIKANAQEQLAVIDGLKEIQKILNQTSGMSTELPHVYTGDVKELRTSIDLIEQLERGEEKVGKQRNTNAEKIRKENKELKERNKILEEKVGPIREGELPPARKLRGRKPKVETYSAMSRDDATGYISDHYDHDVWDKWYSKSLDPFRTKIAETLEADIKMRNAALNQMWDEYKHLTGQDIGFDEFLNKKIPLYRGEPLDSQSQSEKALSFSLTPQTAEEFGERVLEIWLRPIDTLGMANPTYVHQPEAEVMVSKDMVPEYGKWRESLVTHQPNAISSDGIKTETDELVAQYQRILSTIREWQTLYQQLQTVSGRDTKELRTNVLSLLQNMSPELVSMIGGQFAENFAQGFKGVKTKDIVTQISRIAGADLLGSVTDQVGMLAGVDLDNFDFGKLPIQETHIDFLKEAFILLEKIDAKNKEIATASVPVVPTEVIGDIIPADDQNVKLEAEALYKVGEAADKAANSKKKFAKANKEVAASVTPSVEGLETEAEVMDEVGEKAKTAWSMTRPGVKTNTLAHTSDELENFNLPLDYMGERGQDAVQIFAKLKSEIEEMTGKPVIIDFVSDVNDEGQLEAVGATLKYVNEEAGVTVKQFYEIQRNQDGVLVATQSHEKATLAAAKAAKVFNTEMQQKLALEQIKTLETQMDDLKLDLTEVKSAANVINDKASLENFNLALRAAKEQAKQLKAGLKGQNTLDTIASMERALLTLPSRLDEVKRRLNALGDIEGVDVIDDVLRSINDEYQRFLTSDDSEEKVKLFRDLTSSMVWANAELRNLSGKNAENQRQESSVKKENDAQKKAARESYAAWWKTAIDAQDEADNYEKILLEREQQEKAKDERIIAARKKKEEEYNAWWQKALFDQERAPNLKYGKTTANSTRRKFDATEGAVDALGVTNPKILAKLDAYKEKVAEVEKLRERFASDHNAAEDTGLVKQFQKAAYEAENIRRGIKAVIDEEQKMMQLSAEQGFDPVELNTDQLSNLENEMIAHAKATAQGRMEIKGWNDDHTKMYYTVTNSKGVVEEMTMALGQGRNMMYQYRTATKETGTLMQQVFKGIKVKAKELLSFVIGGGSIYKAIAMLRQGIQYVREIDLALTELKKVTDETEESYDKFLETAAKTAEKVGSTIQKVVSSTADWARLGYSMKEAAEFAESTQILMNVSEFTDVSQATDTLISAVQAFGYTAETSMDVVDLLNTIGKQNCRNHIVIYG